MVPTPQEPTSPQAKGISVSDSNRIVISGISGLYPLSRHIKDLSEILYNKENPVTAEKPRWDYNHPEVSQHVGLVPNLNTFDAQFFRVHFRLSQNMDSMGRKILEQSYQAIYDSGVSPEHLSGKKVGVFIGTCFSETEKASFYVATSRTGFGIAGCNKSMFANRVSYWLNAKGPSQSIDAAGCSSTVALEQAYLAMSRGDCEAAIVGGANLCLHPQTSLHYGRIIKICKDGKTKSFDQNADGCARSEAINVLFLQKAKDALRIYADVIHVKNKFFGMVESETGPRFGFYRDPVSMSGFLKEFYQEANISPKDVEYVEGFGSADTDADKVELDAIDKVFCDNRTEPLLVGSVISNLGYCEAASGITAITKVVLGYHSGELAGNLNYTTSRSDVEGIREGRMQILKDHQPFKRTYVGVNGISVTGINSHVLLHGHYKPKDPTRYQCSFPRLVTISARQDSAVENIISDLKSRPIDPEELALLHNIHSTKISGHLGRGFTILDTDENKKTVSLCEKADYFDGGDRPLWFVYSGMGSQWAGMGTQLMRIPIFAAAIQRCHKVLQPKGIDIVHIITSTEKTIFDNILHSFVGIAAVQIGLTDVLRELGLTPDKIIGHSVGELGCAYADGCLTAEEMILSAYSRGLVSIETPFIRGSMAAVGIGFEEVSKLCPPEIEVACHNGPESSTISGPADIMAEFVARLTAKGIFAKEVPCSNIAYHSRYIAEAGPDLLKYLTDVIKTPKARSERWLSTSVPQSRWNEEFAKFSSAEYHTNNLLSPVLFEETSRLVPATAVLVEVAPHGLLQAILKRSLPPSCAHVPLTRRAHPDNARFLLEAIGKLYMEGYFPDVRVLYPKIEFPVSTGTPLLSHLVEWAHNETWFLPLYVSADRKATAGCKFVISLHDSEHKYMRGHVIKGKTLFPFAGALVAVWDTLAMSLGAVRKQLSVQFRDVQLFAQPALHDSRQLRLAVTLNRGTGLFEVMDDISKVASGYINASSVHLSRGYSEIDKEDDALELNTQYIYRIFSERYHDYTGMFQSIYNTNASFTKGHIHWEDNWVTLIDGMLQLNTLRQPHNVLCQPVYIRNINIDMRRHHNNKITKINNFDVIKANINPVHDITSCGGVLMENIIFREISNPQENKMAVKALNFVPRFRNLNDIDVKGILQVFIQIVEENIRKHEINVVEIYDKKGDAYILNNAKEIMNEVPGVNIRFFDMRKCDVIDSVAKKADLVLVTKLSTDDTMCQTLYRLLKRNVFILNAEDLNEMTRIRPSALYSIISAHSSNKIRLELIRWRPKSVAVGTNAFTVRTQSDLALLHMARANLPPRHRMIIFATYPPISGLKDLVKQWRMESEKNQIDVVVFKNKISESLNIDQLPDLDLSFNVINNGEWGGEYYEPLQEKSSCNTGIYLKCTGIGDLESLQWVRTDRSKESGVPVQVHFAGPNLCDVKKAFGEIPDGNNDSCGGLGMDFSGITESGERVMGLVRGGALSDRVAARPELLWPVPEHWSLEDAATVPLPYAHAYYCLAIKSQLRHGMCILVHGGTGALGQAVISIALYLKCRVFAAVGDTHKKRLLLKLFPELRDNHILSSRDENFGDVVLSSTNGRGCDIVLTCGKRELKTAFIRCCAKNGLTLEINELNSQENYALGMHHLKKERTLTRVDFSSIFEHQNIVTMKKLQALMAEGIKNGVVRPLSRIVYAPNEAPRAFRLLAGSRHRGRVLLRLQPMPPLPTQPRLICSADRCQLLLSDDEGQAIQLANTLVSRGARTLHLHLQSPPSSYHPVFTLWQKLGVKVQISTEDLANSKSVLKLLTESSNMGLVEGIFVMITQALTDETHKHYESLVVNLDAAARKSCPTMKFFAIVGFNNFIGQQLCLSRGKDRLPAMTLNVVKDDKSIPVNEISNALEEGLNSMQPVLLAHEISDDDKKTLCESIAAIAGVIITKDTSESATLQDLGISLDRAQAVSLFLRHTQNISIDENKIPSLSIEKIRDLQGMLKESEFTPKRGLEALISYVDSDELLATVEMVSLPTLSHSSTMRDDELDTHLSSLLCIIPGVEGHHRRYRLMCERLKMRAFVLQPGLDKPDESLQEMTDRFAKILLKKLNANKKFYLLGYEMGVITALEIAAILEDHGLSGTVFCLGGGPDECQAELEHHLREATASSVGGNAEDKQALQQALVRHICTLMGGGSSLQLEVAKRDTFSWQEEVMASVRALRGRVAHSTQYARALIEASYARVIRAREHAQAQVAPRALRSRVVLLRSPTPQAAPDPHPLQRYSQLPLGVHDLRAPLTCAPDDLRVAAIIHQYVDDEVLKEFDNKNLCETYLLNADVFMTA
ncbi:fatty acid synthase-like [Choristoneura fumiferana]|uniref:fatty acid synthase-like n=1 Tax=Choristoneura fumiferana TaxID=7141 RepID=UPI003D154770